MLRSSLGPWMMTMMCLGLAGTAAGQSAPLPPPPTTQPGIDVHAPAERIALAEQVRARYAGRSETLKIDHVRPVADTVGLYQRFELQFDLDGRFDSAFDPDQIKVDARITRPDGSTITVPAFFMEPFQSLDGQSYLEMNVHYKPAGRPGWRLRYAPTQPGEHTVVLVAEQASPKQTVTAEPVRFTATASDHAGYVRVSPRNPQYFEYSASGRLFFPAASNIAWTRTKQGREMGRPDGSYEYYFGKARGNMNATRVWACHYAWLEWMPFPGSKDGSSWRGYGGLNHYNQMIASTLDRVFEMGEEYDLRIMFVLDDNDEHGRTPATGWIWHAWAANPYNVINGGPCTNAPDFFANEAARHNYRKRLRYVLARWGYSPALWAINVWNDRVATQPPVISWLKEMHAYTHSIADGWRPLIFGTNFAFEAQAISDYYQAQESGPLAGKPNVKQECYYTRNGKWFVDTLRFELWKHLSRGYGGVMVWPHPQVDEHNAWPTFKSVHTFLADVPLNQRPTADADVRVTSAVFEGDAGAASRIVAVQEYGDVPHWGARATADRFEIDLSAGSQFLPGMCRRLYSRRPQQISWRVEPTFLFDLPAPGSLVMEIREICGTNRLDVSDKGRPLMSIDIQTDKPERHNPVGEKRYVRIPLDAGSHELKLALEGEDSDWIDMRRLLIVYDEPDPARLLTVYGQSSDRLALVYLRNETYGELPQTFLKRPPTVIRDVQLEIAGLAPGRYETVVYDVNEGREIERRPVDHAGGALPVRVGDVEQHKAVKVVPAQ